MEVKHTPGPWEIDTIQCDGVHGNGDPDQERTGFDAYAVFDAQGRLLFDSLNRDGVVSEIHEDDYADEYGDVRAWDELARRDMTVAAAAPEMLEALQAIEFALRMGAKASDVLDENSPIRDGIRAAIAKAEGQHD